MFSLHSTSNFLAASFATGEMLVQVYKTAFTPVILIGPPKSDNCLRSSIAPRRKAYSNVEPNNWNMLFLMNGFVLRPVFALDDT
jgi:hypothetical protein